MMCGVTDELCEAKMSGENLLHKGSLLEWLRRDKSPFPSPTGTKRAIGVVKSNNTMGAGDSYSRGSASMLRKNADGRALAVEDLGSRWLP